MEQTFNDLCRERAEGESGLFGFVLWVFVETSVGIIRENITLITMQNKNIIRIALATAVILLIPLVLTLLGDGVDGKGWNWKLGDFVFAFVLLFGTGLTYELVVRKGGTVAYRAAVGVALAATFLLVWINAAVGIIGDDNPANLMYLGVLAVGFIGAVIARLEPRGMSHALFATALAQALVPVIALIIWKPSVISWAPGVLPVFALNAFFVMLFAVSALLFRHAAYKHN